MDKNNIFAAGRPLLLDGAMGTMLDALGVGHTNSPERLCLTDPDKVKSVHRAYIDAGAHAIYTNTFGANGLKYGSGELKDVIFAAVRLAREAAEEKKSGDRALVALDIGPLGRLLEPLGDTEFEQAVGVFSETARLGEAAGADLIVIETMNDLYEAKAALLAAKESSSLPVHISCAYSENGRLMTGADPRSVIATLEGLGADALGVNCSFGPDTLMPVLEVYLRYSSVPVFFKPNAGLPSFRDGRTSYDVKPEDFAASAALAAEKGAFAVGGCCGTTPEHVKALSKALKKIIPPARRVEEQNVVCSGCRSVELGKKPVIIGERINPTGKKLLRKAITEGDFDYAVSEGVRQSEAGADVIDVNVGVPGLDETANLVRCVRDLQEVCTAPLELDSSSPAALSAAMRIYNGRPLVNSVNGRQESMDAVFPLIKKYGGAVVALLLDENGIPDEPAGRLEIAGKIIREAEKYGIKKSDILFDALTLPVGADPEAANVTLTTLRALHDELGVKTVLGVSNVSYGLPDRGKLNAAFLASALSLGLDAAIADPTVQEISDAFRCHAALRGFDPGFEKYVSSSVSGSGPADTRSAGNLREAVYLGRKDSAADFASSDEAKKDPLGVINGSVIPALDDVGRDYEAGRAFLPRLIACAEAAGRVFDVLSPYFAVDEK
ncbi:MAG: homocysteine S-methyltransferase family protein, partial [Clostridia bacterium]|nr:homocysteine S-methyltransferase family protein [Clostridia bacterium]